jgi:hypothetical protein
MAAWRALLYLSVRSPRSSVALSLAVFIATMRALCSEAFAERRAGGSGGRRRTAAGRQHLGGAGLEEHLASSACGTRTVPVSGQLVEELLQAAQRQDGRTIGSWTSVFLNRG